MELLNLESNPLEYKWRDVVFKIKNRMSSGDKWKIVCASRDIGKNEVHFSPWDYYTTMVKTFVIGWNGVTDKGAEVPYSYETLMTRLPSDTNETLIMDLGLFIAKSLGFIIDEESNKKADDLKNG